MMATSRLDRILVGLGGPVLLYLRQLNRGKLAATYTSVTGEQINSRTTLPEATSNSRLLIFAACIVIIAPG